MVITFRKVCNQIKHVSAHVQEINFSDLLTNGNDDSVGSSSS